MPRTRLDLDRQEKVDQLVDLAVGQLRKGGYGALSIAAIAREAGVAQNAVYWYFPNKDHLLVAAVERMVGELRGQPSPEATSLDDRVVWMVERIAAFEDLGHTLRTRSKESEVVAEYWLRIDVEWREIVGRALGQLVPDEHRRALVVDVLISTLYGAIARPLTDERRTEIVRFTLSRLAVFAAPDAGPVS